jgi:hypothetical protein
MRLSPVLAAVAALGLILASSAPAFALCLLCNASVRLDSGLAACLAERADDELQKLTASGKDFVIVNLTDCSSRGGLPTGESAEKPLDVEFVTDAQSLKCLNEAIAALDDTALTPSHLFDLTKDCPAQ